MSTPIEARFQIEETPRLPNPGISRLGVLKIACIAGLAAACRPDIQGIDLPPSPTTRPPEIRGTFAGNPEMLGPEIDTLLSGITEGSGQDPVALRIADTLHQIHEGSLTPDVLAADAVPPFHFTLIPRSSAEQITHIDAMDPSLYARSVGGPTKPAQLTGALELGIGIDKQFLNGPSIHLAALATKETGGHALLDAASHWIFSLATHDGARYQITDQAGNIMRNTDQLTDTDERKIGLYLTFAHVKRDSMLWRLLDGWPIAMYLVPFLQTMENSGIKIDSIMGDSNFQKIFTYAQNFQIRDPNIGNGSLADLMTKGPYASMAKGNLLRPPLPKILSIMDSNQAQEAVLGIADILYGPLPTPTPTSWNLSDPFVAVRSGDSFTV